MQDQNVEQRYPLLEPTQAAVYPTFEDAKKSSRRKKKEVASIFAKSLFNLAVDQYPPMTGKPKYYSELIRAPQCSEYSQAKIEYIPAYSPEAQAILKQRDTFL